MLLRNIMNNNDLKKMFLEIESFPLTSSKIIMSEDTYNDILMWNASYYYICY